MYQIDFKDSELIFSVSSQNISQKDINFNWKAFDTLIITYNKKLEIFQQKWESKTINPKITIEYITE